MQYYAPFYRFNEPMMPQASTPQPQPQQQSSPLIWVSGEVGAKSYPVAPGSTVMLMDAENTTFYLKSADASGMPLPLRIFDYKERTCAAPQPAPTNQVSNNEIYITREEFEKRLEEMASQCHCKKKHKEETVDEPLV